MVHVKSSGEARRDEDYTSVRQLNLREHVDMGLQIASIGPRRWC